MAGVIEDKFGEVDAFITQLETKSKQAEDIMTQMKHCVGFLNERDDIVERVIPSALACT